MWIDAKDAANVILDALERLLDHGRTVGTASQLDDIAKDIDALRERIQEIQE